MVLPDWLVSVVPAEATQRDLREAAIVQVVEAVKRNALERSRAGQDFSAIRQNVLSEILDGLVAIDAGAEADSAVKAIARRRKKEEQDTGGHRLLSPVEVDAWAEQLSQHNHNFGEDVGLIFVLLEHLGAVYYKGSDFEDALWNVREAICRHNMIAVEAATNLLRDKAITTLVKTVAAAGGGN